MLSTERLSRRLKALAWGEKQVLVAFLRHLDEFDQRKGYAPLGYPSLFRYCVGELGLSEDEACLRILAARRGREYPQILEMLGKGELHLSGLARLSAHLSEADGARLLAQARGKSKRDVERLAASRGEAAPKADTVRFLAPRAFAPNGGSDMEQTQFALSAASAPADALASGRPRLERAPSTACETPAPRGPLPVIEGGGTPAPATPGAGRPQQAPLARIAFTASEELLLKIERARALLRHKYPGGRMEQLAGEAFDALLARLDPVREPRRAAPRLSPAPAGSAAGAGSRHVPLRVRAEVWRRDGGRCAYVSPEGLRYPATEWLEYDHIVPYALGGRSDDPAGIRLLCRTHNTLAARQVFGEGPWRRRPKRKQRSGGIKAATSVTERMLKPDSD